MELDKDALPNPSDPEWNKVWNQAARWILTHRGCDVTTEAIWPVYAKLVAGQPLDQPIDFTRIVEPSRSVPPLPLPHGLVLRQINASELQTVADSLDQADTRAILPREISILEQLVEWYNDPDCWFLVLEHGGRHLSYEVLHFDREGRRVVSTFLTYRDHERCSWFWRECARPVFEYLLAEGWSLESFTTFPHWKERLESRYSVRVLPGEGWRILFNLKESLAMMPGWPERRTIPGFDYRDGDVEVRELQYEEALALLADVWGRRNNEFTQQNHKQCIRILSERWFLDSAAVLGGWYKGEFKTAVVLSPRTDHAVGQATLTPLSTAGWNGRMYLAFTEWEHYVGYKKIQAWVPDWQFPLATRRFPWKKVQQFSASSLVEVDIEEMLRRDRVNWTKDLDDADSA